MFIPRRSSWISSPYHPCHQTVRERSATSRMVPKVISIPVRFVGSDESPAKKTAAAATVAMASMDSEVATVKVQKVARGFLVRKNVKVVRGVEAEVEKIEKKIEGEKELIWKEEKERLRVSEMLMVILFKLDSVRGVRGYRKKVVRRAVLVQEALDSIANADSGKVEVGPREKMKGGTMDADAASCNESRVLEENCATERGNGDLEEEAIAEHGEEEDAVEGDTQEEKERVRSMLDSKETGDASSGESSVVDEENHTTAIKTGASEETLEVERNEEDAVVGTQEGAMTVDGVGSKQMGQGGEEQEHECSDGGPVGERL